jgi:hypothetical protein
VHHQGERLRRDATRSRTEFGGPRLSPITAPFALSHAPPSNRRPSVLLQQIAERLVGKLLKRFLGLAREQVERMPSLRIELDQLPPGLCRLLGHEKPPLKRGAPVAQQARW